MKADLLSLQALVAASGILIVWLVFRMKLWGRISKRLRAPVREQAASADNPPTTDLTL